MKTGEIITLPIRVARCVRSHTPPHGGSLEKGKSPNLTTEVGGFLFDGGGMKNTSKYLTRIIDGKTFEDGAYLTEGNMRADLRTY